MSRVREVCTAFLLVLCFGANAHAQFEHCKQVLSDGIWDIKSGSSSSSYQRSFVNWFCSQSFSSETDFKNKAASLKIPIEGVPVQAGGHSRSQSWKSYYSSACSMQDEFISQLNSSDYFSKVANSEIVKAWTQCIGQDNFGLRMAHYSTSAPGLFRVDLSYRSNKTPPDSASLKKVVAYQADSKGNLAPLSCKSLDATFTPEGSATNVEVPQGNPVSFTCQRNVCSTAFVEVSANTVVAPDNKIELRPIPDFNAGCVPPPISGCTKYNTAGDKCLRCEFKLDMAGAQFQFHDRLCNRMPEGELVQVEFNGNYTVSNRGAGSDCWLADRLRNPDGTSPHRRDYTNVATCSVNATRTSGFVLPKNKGQGTGGIQVEQCQWGGNPNMSCHLKGTLSIYTADGQ